jgi:hypothetical protein
MNIETNSQLKAGMSRAPIHDGGGHWFWSHEIADSILRMTPIIEPLSPEHVRLVYKKLTPFPMTDFEVF